MEGDERFLGLHAEDAVREHMAGYLQPEFEKAKGHKASFPFSSSLSPQQIKEIVHRNIAQSDRYRLLKKAGMSESEIDRLIDTSTDSGLTFRPLYPRLETKLYIIWKKYQSFSPISKGI